MFTLTDPWFHAEQIPDPGEAIVLDPRESLHATGARRLHEGDAIILCNGVGMTAQAAISQIGRTRREGMLVEIIAVTEHGRSAPELRLMTSLPKGDRLSTMLSMATQLRVGSIAPLTCHRSETRTDAPLGERAHRICIEACKQSRNPWLPELHAPLTIDELCVEVAAARHELWAAAHPGGDPVMPVLRDGAAQGRITCVIGPEGGFTDEEAEALRSSGARIVSLGTSMLRIETAAISMCAAVRLLADG